MITEDYVSFEIAKLLKEKGFDVPVYQYYFPPSNDNLNYSEFDNDWNSVWEHSYSAPTLQMALKWLREAHNLHIDVFIGSDESHDADGVMVDEWHFWTYYITNTSGDMIYDAYNEVDVIEYQTHEEAVEAALKYTLENLI